VELVGTHERTIEPGESALELLQQLGLKEYESQAFVALSRPPAWDGQTDQRDLGRPRTRVYDAVRVLETKGLVEVQHTNPQQFRAVSIASSIETLRNEYDSRVESLRGRSAGSNRSRTTTARKPPTRSGRCLGSRRSSRERRG